MKITQDWTRLADAVVRRRVELGLKTTKSLAAKMGLGARLVGEIENARRSSYSAGTLAALELALEWAPGSVESILVGRAPAPIEAVSPERARKAEATRTLNDWARKMAWSGREHTESLQAVEDALRDILQTEIAFLKGDLSGAREHFSRAFYPTFNVLQRTSFEMRGGVVEPGEDDEGGEGGRAEHPAPTGAAGPAPVPKMDGYPAHVSEVDAAMLDNGPMAASSDPRAQAEAEEMEGRTP